MLMDQERQDGRRHDGADLVYATDNGEVSVQGSVDRRIHLDVVLNLLLLRQFQHVADSWSAVMQVPPSCMTAIVPSSCSASAPTKWSPKPLRLADFQICGQPDPRVMDRQRRDRLALPGA